MDYLDLLQWPAMVVTVLAAYLVAVAARGGDHGVHLGAGGRIDDARPRLGAHQVGNLAHRRVP